MPLEIVSLCKSFDGRPILQNLSHTFADGATTCIIGPSGCGKTTLLHLILGLLAPDSGKIHGLPRAPIAAVFQEDRLIEPLSALQNASLALPRGASKSDVVQILTELGLREAIHQPVCTLSGGMRRRVALARALAIDSPLVVMDEPFKGLDAKTRASVIACVRRKLLGHTALIVTHDPDEAQLLGASIFEMP